MSKKTRKKLPKRIIALIVAGAFIAVLGFTLLGFYIGFWVADGEAHTWTPAYEMLDGDALKAIYDKPEPSEEDYEILFRQTGLTKTGIDRAKKQKNGWAKVLAIQKSYFTERGVETELYAPLVCTDYHTGDPAEMIYLERGDILITSSTHFSGFRIGHSAIAVDNYGRIFQSNQVGVASGYARATEMFGNRTNFMVVRIKPEYFSDAKTDDEQYRSNLDRVTSYIENDLKDVKYSVFTGIFTKKDSLAATSCAHMIWYGFKHFDDANDGKFNLDLDSNGRLLIVPKNISESPYVELVQTFGFDPEKMYE